MTMGVIVGNRGFFPDHLAKTGREEVLRALEQAGMDTVALDPAQSKYGAVETHEEAKRCAALFQEHRHRIDGVIVHYRISATNVRSPTPCAWHASMFPVLVQATPDSTGKMTIAFRRDQLLRKNVSLQYLKQYGIAYSLTSLHTVSPDSKDFQTDLAWFAAVCRVVNGLRDLRIGSIGARPAAFNTVRYSEKILESQGISVETVDLSEILVACGPHAPRRYRVPEAWPMFDGQGFPQRSTVSTEMPCDSRIFSL